MPGSQVIAPGSGGPGEVYAVALGIGAALSTGRLIVDGVRGAPDDLQSEVEINLTFGAPRRNRLFPTASRSIHALTMNAQGAGPAEMSLPDPRGSGAGWCRRIVSAAMAAGTAGRYLWWA